MKITSDITVRLVQSSGGDHMVVAAARVSTSGEEALEYANQDSEDSYGLIRYLMKHKHGTPFEHASLTFFVHAPLFVVREWQRHRMASYNEESGRYKQLDPVFWEPRRTRPIEPVPDFKAARPEFALGSDEMYDMIEQHDQVIYAKAYACYQREINAGISREVARRLLPLSIYSSFWVTMNPRSLMHFLSLRTHHAEGLFTSYPQAEIEEAALQVEKMFAEGWPLTYRAFNECGRYAP